MYFILFCFNFPEDIRSIPSRTRESESFTSPFDSGQGWKKKENTIKGSPFQGIHATPFHLVLSCCSTCFFFVQRFKIYHPLSYVYAGSSVYKRASPVWKGGHAYPSDDTCADKETADRFCNPNNACVDKVT